MLSLVLLAALAVSPTTGNLVVVADTPFALYIDGQQVNVANLRTSWTTYDLTAGRHDVRVEAWPSPFRRENLAAGIVDVPGGAEVRVRAEKDRLVVYETIALLPTAPPQEVIAVAPAANVQMTLTGPGGETMVVTAPVPQVVVETQYAGQQEAADYHRDEHHERGDRHAHHGGHHGGYVMDPGSFEALRGAISAESFENKKLDVLETAAASNRFTVDQVGQLVDLLTFSNGKVRVVEICRNGIVDPENAFQLYSHFTFEADKRRVRSILGR